MQGPFDPVGAGGVAPLVVEVLQLVEVRDRLEWGEVVEVGGSQSEVDGQGGEVRPEDPPQMEGSVTTRVWPVSCQSISG